LSDAAVLARLRDLGHDVVAVAEHGDLRAMSDEDIFAWAAAQRRWLPTESVKDKNPGPLIQAIHAWLLDGSPEAPLTEGWLLSPEDR
jgi:hypothetical protein